LENNIDNGKTLSKAERQIKAFHALTENFPQKYVFKWDKNAHPAKPSPTA
jgi:hypothetical protein